MMTLANGNSKDKNNNSIVVWLFMHKHKILKEAKMQK